MGLSSGLHRLVSEETGTAWVYVPEGVSTPRPLLVLFHGAGGQARDMIDLLREQADARGMVLLAPQSAGATWDLMSRKGYGQDAAALQRLMAALAGLVSIEPARVGVGGFSDGASYALSLGLDNGDLFHSVLAFSPGFANMAHRTGSPRVFVSHGVADPVLNIDRCSRALVPRLRELGYGVTYQEFPGKHLVPPEIASAAVEWFARG